MRFLESMSAAVLSTPGTCEVKMLLPKNAQKNLRHQSRCMPMGSFDEPLLMAATRLLLSHLNSRDFLIRRGPQMAQLGTIGTNSFAMMSILVHSADHFK